MSEQEPETLRDTPTDTGDTTHDISKAASKAVRRFNEQSGERLRESKSYPVIEGSTATLKIDIEGATAPILLTFEGDATIGRRDPLTMVTPEFDLTPYGGYQMGISRRHALLRLNENRVEITDLGSRNGTYMDGARLEAHEPQPVHDGAELRIGKIIMTLYFEHSD